MKKHLSRFLLCVMLVSAVMGILPASADESAPYSYRHVDFSVDSPENYSPESIDPEGGVPAYQLSAYSSVTAGETTAVKNQGNYGTCWAFSAISVLESSLSGERFFTANNTDLSELQLVHFFYNENFDPLGNASGDKTENISEENKFNIGGNHVFTTWALADWLGGAPDSVLAYTNKNIVSSKNDRIGSEFAYQYDVAHVQNIRMLPIGSDNAKITDMKKAIVEYGGLAIGYYSDDDYLNDSAYYYTNLEGGNHAVTIVGWNDSVPKSKFAHKSIFSTLTPAGDGAWLVKNSWGVSRGTDGDEEYLDEASGGGYFWLSYYDASLLYSEVAYVFDSDPASTYRYNYQYDGAYGDISTDLPDGSQVAATFTVAGKTDESEVISAVGIGLASVNVSYSLQVYKNESASPENPDSGTPLLAEPLTGTTDFEGFYTIPIPEELRPTLAKGDTFSVVLTLNSANGGSIGCFVDTSYAISDWVQFTANTENDLTWTTETGSFQKLTDCTLRLKAYTNDTPPENPIKTVTIGNRPANDTLDCTGETTHQLSAEVTAQIEDATDDTLVWCSSDSSVVTVDQTGLLTVKKAGDAVITAYSSYTGLGESFTLHILRKISSIAFASSSQTVSLGNTLTLTPTVLPADATEKPVWSSSAPEVATVDPDTGLITTVSKGTTVITAQSPSGEVQDQCELTVNHSFNKADLGNGKFVLVFDGKAMGVESGVLKTVSFSPEIDQSDLPSGYTWTVTSKSGGYVLQNTATGYYLRMNSSGWLFKSYTVGLSSSYSDDSAFVWKTTGSNGSYKFYRAPVLIKRYLRYSSSAFSINTSSSSAASFTAYRAD